MLVYIHQQVHTAMAVFPDARLCVVSPIWSVPDGTVCMRRSQHRVTRAKKLMKGTYTPRNHWSYPQLYTASDCW